MDIKNLKPVTITREQIREVYDQGPEAVEELVFSLVDTINQLICIVQEQSLKIEAQDKRIKKLEDQLNKNSRNSNKPPSTDSPFQNKSKGSGKKKRNNRKGTTIKFNLDPDERVHLAVSECENCQTDLTNIPAEKIERRQIVDIPPILSSITEYTAETKTCPSCGAINKAVFPDTVSNRFQYSDKIQAMAVYLKDYQLVPVKRVKELFYDLFNLKISEGTLVNMTSRCSASLSGFIDLMKDILPKESLLHCDETGINISGKLNWIHTVGNKSYTFLHPHPKRGSDAIDEMGVLAKFKGCSVHDFWKPYEKIKCHHSYCNAHLIRELIAAGNEWHQHWATDMIRLLLRIKKHVDKSSNGCVNSRKAAAFRKKYRNIIRNGYISNPPPENILQRAKPKKGKILCLVERMDQYRNDILRFMIEPEVPFTNNLAERDLRMMKVRQKVSGTFRNLDRAEDFCRIRSYISTLKKQKMDVFKHLCAVLDTKTQADFSYL